MIERQTGVESYKEFSTAVARRRGKYKGKLKLYWFVNSPLPV